MENGQIQGASISCDMQHEDVQMCVVLESGEVYSFFFPNYSKYFHSEQEIEIEISNRMKVINFYEYSKAYLHNVMSRSYYEVP